MKYYIPKFSKGAASTSTLTILGVCLIVVVIAMPILAVSFSAMALWKSPETVPTGDSISVAYGIDGAPSGSGTLVKDCPAVKTVAPSGVANYNKWVDMLNTAAQGTSASPALLTAILYMENGRIFPDLTGNPDKCKDGKCIRGWPVSTSYAYGPFQFLNGTWWERGMTPEERTALLNANGNAGHTNWWDYPLTDDQKTAILKKYPGVTINDPKIPVSDSVFDNARAAKGAAIYLGANYDRDAGPTERDKIRAAIQRYNDDMELYVNPVYEYYLKFATCLNSPSGSFVATGEKALDVVGIATDEAARPSSISSLTPEGYHTKEQANCVKYMNADVSDEKSVKCAAWCAAFVNWVYRKAGYELPVTASNTVLMDFFNDKEGPHTFLLNAEITDPVRQIQKGDIIFMNSKSSTSGYHAGIVTKYEDGKIFTIEGNLGFAPVDKVDKTSHKLTDNVKECKYNPVTKKRDICTTYMGIFKVYAIARW